MSVCLYSVQLKLIYVQSHHICIFSRVELSTLSIIPLELVAELITEEERLTIKK